MRQVRPIRRAMTVNTNCLREARLASGLDLRAVAERTCISPLMLRHIDEGRFQKLPAGIYARAWVKAFAQAVGLEPDVALREVGAQLPIVDGWQPS
jgi:cytoskeletal protein RodZ